MNSFRLTLIVALIGLCCSQLDCAHIDTINEFLDAKTEPIFGDNIQNGINALRELREKKSKAIHTRLGLSVAIDLIDEMLEAASWIEQKNCTQSATHHRFDSLFTYPGSASRLLLNILDKRDIACAKDLVEKEQLRYNSLDKTQTSKVEKIEQLTLKGLERRVSADKEKNQDLVWEAANKYSFTMELLNHDFYDSLLEYLETESHEDRCQFIGERAKDLVEQHISSPCDYFTSETRFIYPKVQDEFEFNIHFKTHEPRPRDSSKAKLIDNVDFNHHLIGYKVCSFINGQRSVITRDLNEELKTQCLKRMYKS